MAERMYAQTRAIQDHNPQLYWPAYEEVMRRRYPGVETMVGAQFWGQDALGTEGLHNEIMFHTGLLGQASKLGRDVRASVPMATYETVDQVIANYEILGIGYEYYPEELEDDLYDIVVPKVADLPMLLADAEEDEHFAPYNNGETLTGGWTGDPMFVDGSSNFLQIIGNKGTNYGSNIITDAGGVSYHLISLLEQYGENFISEEGTPSPLGIDRIMAGRQNAKLLNMYFGASMNIEQDNPQIPNPAESSPDIISTFRLANPNDLIVFYDGWDEDLKERSKYRNRAGQAEIGYLNQRKVVNITRSRYAYYWLFNRRVVLVKGAGLG